MRAVVITEPGAAAVYDIRRWDPAPSEVLIRCAAVGICTTERSIFTGHRPIYPALGGHELVGVVASLPDVECGVEVGDVVAVDAVRRCGSCYHCLRDRSNQCDAMRERRPREGFVLIGGGFAEYTTARVTGLFTLPSDVDVATATLIEPLACCLHSVQKAQLHAGDIVVILGAGTMGLLHLELCARLDSRVIVVDMNQERLDLAAQLGAAETVNLLSADPVSTIGEATDGRGADAIFVTTGNETAGRQALAMAGPMASVVLYASAYPSFRLDVDWNEIHYREIRLTGSQGKTQTDFAEAVRLFVDGEADLRVLIAERISLDELPEEFGRARPRSGRVVVEHRTPTPSRSTSTSGVP